MPRPIRTPLDGRGSALEWAIQPAIFRKEPWGRRCNARFSGPLEHMAKTTQFSCDVCGVVKKDANHWFKLRVVDALHLYSWDFPMPESSDEIVLHLCGQQHVIEKVTEFMNTGTITGQSKESK